jgi:hypothetical protein
MSNTTVRDAVEQCAEYIDRERVRARRAQADQALQAHLVHMRRQFGLELTLGALFRYVGQLLTAHGSNALVRIGRRYLIGRLIAGLLTKRPVVH